MAQYYWTYVIEPKELNRYRIEEPLLTRAVTLLSEGLPIEVGEMWYGGKFHYRIRYTPRTDYSLHSDDIAVLHINQADPGIFWVMGADGSIHNMPFLTLEAAEAYMQKRLAEVQK